MTSDPQIQRNLSQMKGNCLTYINSTTYTLLKGTQTKYTDNMHYIGTVYLPRLIAKLCPKSLPFCPIHPLHQGTSTTEYMQQQYYTNNCETNSYGMGRAWSANPWGKAQVFGATLAWFRSQLRVLFLLQGLFLVIRVSGF